MDGQEHMEMEMKFTGEVGGLELCIVCGDRASGRHYGAISCEGCKGFFKRSIRKKLGYQCRGTMSCEVTKHHRNRCQYCRLQKCLACGMRSDSVQHERKPIVDKAKGEPRDDRQAAYCKLLGLAGQVNPKEEPAEYSASTPAPLFNNIALAAAVAFNKAAPSVPGYLPPGGEEARRQQLMLQTQLAKNLFKMGQFGAINEYLQSYAAPADAPAAPPPATPQPDDEDGLLSPRLSLALPPPAPPPLRLHAACEAAARLLAATAKWLARLPAAMCLPFEVQVVLMKKCWPELFVLGLVQFNQQLQLGTLLPALVGHLHGELRERLAGTAPLPVDESSPEITVSDYSDERVVEVRAGLSRLTQLLAAAERLRLNERELQLLRALVLFSPDGAPDALVPQLSDLQALALRGLRNCTLTGSAGASASDARAATLLLLLPPLRAFTGPFIEDVFFVGFLGDVSIDEVIPQLLHAER